MAELVGEFTIPVRSAAVWQAKHLSANQRLSRHPRNERTQYWRQLAAVLVRKARVRRQERVRIEIWYRFPNNQRREVANLQPTSKAIVDGIVDAKVIRDDRDEVCTGPDNRRTWPNGPHEVRVKIFKEEGSND